MQTALCIFICTVHRFSHQIEGQSADSHSFFVESYDLFCKQRSNHPGWQMDVCFELCSGVIFFWGDKARAISFGWFLMFSCLRVLNPTHCAFTSTVVFLVAFLTGPVCMCFQWKWWGDEGKQVRQQRSSMQLAKWLFLLNCLSFQPNWQTHTTYLLFCDSLFFSSRGRAQCWHDS